MFDLLQEISATIKKNKLRTFLTGFSIAWGIFMLIVLLGAGNGLRNGVTSNFKHRALNTVTIWDGWTTKPYKGLPVDRHIYFNDKDIEFLKKEVPEVTHVSGMINKNNATITHNDKYGAWTIRGVDADAGHINNVNIVSKNGRFINSVDIEQKRKVIVISTEMQEILFQDEDPIGKYVLSDNTAYQVIGVYKDESGWSNIPAYVPFSTAQVLYNTKERGFYRLDFVVDGLTTIEANQDFVKRLRQKMALRHNFDPEDNSAIWINNRAEDVVESEQIFGGITMFIWVIGILSLMAGIVGVSNIMLITVKERTREFGIRKAIGASPFSILKLVLLESVIITAISGYVGMVAGIGLTELISKGMEMGEQVKNSGPKVFTDPTVDLGVVAMATLVLIVAGVIAGYVPAKRAVSVSPIEAMRAE